VDRDDEPGEQLPVDVGGDTDAADDEEDDVEQGRAVEDGVDERTVRDRCDHEPAGQPVCRQPAFVARTGESPDRARVARAA
jgi:hypothetical protein